MRDTFESCAAMLRGVGQHIWITDFANYAATNFQDISSLE